VNANATTVIGAHSADSTAMPTARAGTRILVAGLLGSAVAWVGKAASLLWQHHGGINDGGWSGWASELPNRAFPTGNCVVHINDLDEAWVASADHVIFVARDVRDAVVAHHRMHKLPADLQTAQRVVEYAVHGERCATLSLTHELILMAPADALQRLASHLGLPLAAPAAVLVEVQSYLAGLNRTAGAHHVARCAYVTALRPEVVAQIELHFGGWLLAHGYSCMTCSHFWAGAVDKTTAREVLWAAFQRLAGKVQTFADIERAGGDLGDERRELVTQILKFCREFGAPGFQLSAAELLATLCEPNSAIAGAQAELLFRDKKWAAAAARARQALARAPDEHISALLLRCATGGGATGERAEPECQPNPAAAIVSEKTAHEPLPGVSRQAAEDQDSIRRLAAHVQGRTVAFLLHGASVAEFAAQAPALVANDVVWASLNHFGLVEERFLRPEGRQLSLVFCCADGEVKRRIDTLESFLGRPQPKLLITRPDQYAEFRDRLAPHRAAIALEKLPPLWPYPNSLTVFLRMLVQAGPRRIVLFGCDGYLGDDDASLPTYVGAEDFLREKRYSGVLLDTLLFNAHLPRILRQWRARLGEAFPEIVNCSPRTLIQGIPTIDYAQAAAALAGRPLVTGSAKWAEAVPVPAPSSSDDPAPSLIACLNAGRGGDLASAREHAMRALRLAPGRLTPFALRVLQTDPRTIAVAHHLLVLTGGGLPGSAEHFCVADLAREIRATREAVGDARHRWDSWD